MKKIFCGLLAVVLCFGLCGCDPNIPAELGENTKEFIGFSPISDENGLYYCEDTKVVYIIFRVTNGNAGYGYMSPYYAPNGFPYLYDANERTLVEINPFGE